MCYDALCLQIASGSTPNPSVHTFQCLVLNVVMNRAVLLLITAGVVIALASSPLAAEEGGDTDVTLKVSIPSEAKDIIEPEVESEHILTVGDALERARTHSQQIQLGQLDVEQSEKARDEVRAGRLPEVSLESRYSNYISRPFIVLPETSPFGEGIMETGARHNFDATVQASVPLYNAQLNRSIDLSRQALAVEQKLQEVTTREVEIEVQRAYLNGLMARQAVEVIEESRQTLEHNLELVQALHEQQAAPEHDLIRMKVQVQNVEPDWLSAVNTYKGALNYLRLLTGIPMDEPIDLDATLEELYSSLPAVGREASFEDNRNIIEVEGQQKLADKRIDVERATYLPTLATFANFSYQGQADHLRVWDYEWTDTAMIGLLLSVPLFSPGRSQRVEQARMEGRRAALQREFIEESLHADFETTQARIAQLDKAISAQKRNVEQAERGFDIAVVSYEEGAYSLLEVNDAEEALREARLNYQQVLGDYISAVLDIEDLLGSTENANEHQ